MKPVLLSFFTILLIACGQSNSAKTTSKVEKDAIAYLQKSVEFIQQVEQENLKDSNFLLADQLFGSDYVTCIQDALKDTIFYTKEEQGFIKHKAAVSTPKWQQAQFPGTRMISSDTLNAIFKDRSKWWAYFNDKKGNSFDAFSLPIFFRENRFCLFYTEHYCGSKCGEGKLRLYKKENHKWREVKTYCFWVS